MNYQQLYKEVIAKTNRPELVAETQLAITQATLRMHSLAWFAKDLAVAQIRFPTAAAGGMNTVAISRNLMRCRKVYAIEGAEELDTSEIFKRETAALHNVWYVLGDSLVIKSTNQVQTVSWVTTPIVTPVTDYSSWIAVQHPYAIVDEAARIVAELTGRAELAASLARNVGSLAQNGALISGHIREILQHNETLE